MPEPLDRWEYKGLTTFAGMLHDRLCSRLSNYESKEFNLTWRTWPDGKIPALRGPIRGGLIAHWPTATATNRERNPATLAKCAAFRKRNANQNTVPLYLGEVARMATPALPVGAELNPSFSRWLLGFPISWDESSPFFSDWTQIQSVKELE